MNLPKKQIYGLTSVLALSIVTPNAALACEFDYSAFSANFISAASHNLSDLNDFDSVNLEGDFWAVVGNSIDNSLEDRFRFLIGAPSNLGRVSQSIFDQEQNIFGNIQYLGDRSTFLFEVPELDNNGNFVGVDIETLRVTPCNRQLGSQNIGGFGEVDANGDIFIRGETRGEIADKYALIIESGALDNLATFETVRSSNWRFTDLLPGAGTNPSISSGSINGVDFVAYDLPFQYLKPLGSKVGILFDSQLSFVDTQYTESYIGTLGLGLKLDLVSKPNFKWSLTPLRRVGYIEATGIESSATVQYDSITSILSSRIAGLKLDLINSFNTFEASKTDDRLSNEVFDTSGESLKTALKAEKDLPFKFANRTLVIDVLGSYTSFDGSNSFITKLTEVSANISTRQIKEGINYNSYRVGFSYVYGDLDYSELRLNFGYKF